MLVKLSLYYRYILVIFSLNPGRQSLYPLVTFLVISPLYFPRSIPATAAGADVATAQWSRSSGCSRLTKVARRQELRFVLVKPRYILVKLSLKT